jgi:hypothetical protein
MECRRKEDVVFMGVAFRELPVMALPAATIFVARSWTPGERPMRILRSWDSPPAGRSRSSENYHGGKGCTTAFLGCQVLVERNPFRAKQTTPVPIVYRGTGVVLSGGDGGI